MLAKKSFYNQLIFKYSSGAIAFVLCTIVLERHNLNLITILQEIKFENLSYFLDNQNELVEIKKELLIIEAVKI